MKRLTLPLAGTLFGLLFLILPPLVSKGKYPFLTLVSVLIGALFITGGVLLYLQIKGGVLLSRVAALTSVAAGLVLVLLLIWGGTYVKSIFGALGAVISGTLFMAVLAVANLFFLIPGILLYALRNRDAQGNSLSS